MGRRYGPQSDLSLASKGIMDRSAASTLGRRIYDMAKKLKPSQKLPAGLARRLAPWHKTDLYAGMQKTSKTYRKATQSSYQTFRTISEANPVGWIHPGITGRLLQLKVEAHLQDVIPKMIGAAIKSALGSY